MRVAAMPDALRSTRPPPFLCNWSDPVEFDYPQWGQTPSRVVEDPSERGEALAPARVARRSSRARACALAFDAPRISVIIASAVLAEHASRPSEPGMCRGGGAPIGLGERRAATRAPAPARRRRRCRSPGRAALDRRERAAGGVVDVHERPHAAAVADDRELARLGPCSPLLAAGRDPGAGAVEAAVAQDDPAGAPVTAASRWRIAASVVRDALRRVGVERVVLGLDRAARRARTARRAKLCATKRSTPAARAAASRWSVPSVRSRLVAANDALEVARRSRSPPSAVIWWTIASGRAAAHRGA